MSDFIEAPLDTNHEITAQIWKIVKKTLDILKTEKILDKVSKIRFVPHKATKLLILCYEENRPTRYVILEQGKTVKVPKEQVAEIDKSISPEEWANAITEKAERYRHSVEGKEKNCE